MISLRSLTLIVGVALGASMGCDPSQGIGGPHGKADGGVPDAGPGVGTGSTFCDMQSLLPANCVACHDGSQALGTCGAGGCNLAAPDLRADHLSDLVGLHSTTYPSEIYVIAGDATNSFLFKKLANTQVAEGVQMPQGSSLSAAKQAQVSDWINAGATTSCTGPVPDAGPAGDAGPGPDGGVTTSACAVLQNRCASCHSATGFAPELSIAAVQSGALVGAHSTTYPSEIYVVSGSATTSFLSKKIHNTQANEGLRMPQPPAPELTADELVLVDDWINNGAPTTDCANAPPPPDPITQSSSLLPNFATTPRAGDYVTSDVCTSGQYWTGREHESDQMRPGDDCIACHNARREGTNYDYMGTVFLGAHDGTNCRGMDPTNYQVFIDILDAQGNVRGTLRPNAAGNFMDDLNNAPNPYRATVRLLDAQGNLVSSATMQTPQVFSGGGGSCNGCHTATANGPTSSNIPAGRITIGP